MHSKGDIFEDRKDISVDWMSDVIDIGDVVLRNLVEGRRSHVKDSVSNLILKGVLILDQTIRGLLRGLTCNRLDWTDRTGSMAL
jgi:hypothetical protein